MAGSCYSPWLNGGSGSPSDWRSGFPTVAINRASRTLVDMIRAHIFAISCGYEDADDLDFLRSDPAFKLKLEGADSAPSKILYADFL